MLVSTVMYIIRMNFQYISFITAIRFERWCLLLLIL